MLSTNGQLERLSWQSIYLHAVHARGLQATFRSARALIDAHGNVFSCIYPISRKPWRKCVVTLRDRGIGGPARYPIRGTFFVC